MRGGWVLALDTSGDMSSVSLLQGVPPHAREVAARRLPGGRTHTHSLLRFVDECLDETGVLPQDLSAVLVGTGPGTFTGVRIGVATARALGLSLERPVLGVSSLSALAAAALTEGRVGPDREALVPLLDARRGQVFGTVFLIPEKPAAGWSWTGEYFVCDPQGVADEVASLAPGRRALLVGTLPGAGVHTAELRLSARHLLLGQETLAPRAGSLVGRGLHAWLSDELTSPRSWGAVAPGVEGTPEAVLPVYVRSPDADLHIKKMKDPWA